MKNKLEDLRDHLFMTIEALLDKDKPMDIERAKAVSEAAQTLINSAKVEVDFIKATGGKLGTGFIREIAPDARNPALPRRSNIAESHDAELQ